MSKYFESIYEHTKILEDVMKSQNSYKRSYCFTSRIRFIVEYNYDLNKLKCECGKIYNFTKFCRACPDPKNTWTGRTHSQETLTKMRQSTINYIESCNGKCVPRYNKKSIEILNNIAKDLGITDNREFLFNEVRFHKIVEFDGHYVIKFKANAKTYGHSIIEQFREHELDMRYENMESKESHNKNINYVDALTYLNT
jgi:hypothetical protein